ncbi:hypothetical protein [Streptomyces rhizosphaericus]|uniref:hypothetical protein n=1 Tax=Streptomyces rhizosphaericus TaxID=114699 RepID=UPI00363D5FBB
MVQDERSLGDDHEVAQASDVSIERTRAIAGQLAQVHEPEGFVRVLEEHLDEPRRVMSQTGAVSECVLSADGQPVLKTFSPVAVVAR